MITQKMNRKHFPFYSTIYAISFVFFLSFARFVFFLVFFLRSLACFTHVKKKRAATHSRNERDKCTKEETQGKEGPESSIIFK